MGELRLSNGGVALVDDDDLERCAQYRWRLARKGNGSHSYAVRSVNHDVQQALHKFILGIPNGRSPIVDHINGDGLDNRRANLRVTDFSGNNRHRRPLKVKRSRFKGVTPLRKKWKAGIRVDGRLIHLGTFETEEEAAAVYDEAAKKHFGDFAWLNFSDGRPLHGVVVSS